MPKGEKQRKLTDADIDEIVRRYTTPLPDGTWEGVPALARAYGVRHTAIYRWLKLRGVRTRSPTEAHAHGKRCKPIRNLPVGDAPLCKCGCGAAVAWHQRKNRWNVYVASHYRPVRPHHDAAWLRRQYLEERRTAAEIAKDCGVNVTTVLKFMAHFGIARRDRSESRRGRMVGARNPAWKGGVADWAYSSDWKLLARQIRDRDAWACQDCGEQRTRWGNGLHVHHIDENKLNNHSSYLVSLCAKCHYKRH